MDKEGGSPENNGLGGLSRRRSSEDMLVARGCRVQDLWEDSGVSQAQRQEQRREFEGWRSLTSLGSRPLTWEHRGQ